MLAIADTHALIWYLCNDKRLSDRAKDMFEMAMAKNESIGISTISLIELIYLTEKGRIPDMALDDFQKEQGSESSILQIIFLNSKISYNMCNIDKGFCTRNARSYNCRNSFTFWLTLNNQRSQNSTFNS